MEHSLVIDALGGPANLSRLLGCHHSRPVRWREEGIPRQRWPEVVEAARNAGLVEVTFDALLRGERPTAEPAA